MNTYLSLVLPAYNASAYIEDSVRTVVGVLERLGRPFEVIVVCDGSTDGTAAVAQRVEDPRVRVLHYPVNAGKGHAICHGVAEARGRLIGWLDADLDISADFVLAAVESFERDDVDAIIGSKRASGSRVQYPAIRRLYSWGFQMLVRLLFRVNVKDTQVGAKLFRREMLETVTPLLLVKRYAFDLEVIAVGAEFGFDRVTEIPVTLEYRFTGTGINWRAVKDMFVDTLAIAYRIHLRHWYVRQFASLQRLRVDGAAPGDGEILPPLGPLPAEDALVG